MNRYREGDLRTLMPTEGEQKNILEDLPEQRPEAEGVLAVQGGFVLNADGETEPGFQYFNQQEANDYVQFQIDEFEQQARETQNTNTLSLIRAAILARQQLLPLIAETKAGAPLDFEEVVGELQTAILLEEGLLELPPPAVAPAVDRTPDGTIIHNLERGTRLIPGG